jgi:selenoprotein W-related protein
MQLGLLDISIEYCAVCKFTPRILALTDEILGEREIESFVRSWTLLPASGGKFEVTVNGELVFSKKALGRHAEPGEVRRAIVQILERLRGTEQPAE